MKSFHAALFDLDGTLIDSEPQYTEFWREIGKAYHPDMPDLSFAIKGTTLPYILSTYFPSPEVQREITEKIDAYELQMDYPLIKGADDFVRDVVASGLKCAVVTSSNQNKMRNVWRHHPSLMSLFDAILTSEDFAASKPDPDCYLKASARLGFTPDECVVFEDAFNGLEAGVRAGMFTVGLATVNSRGAIADRCHHVIDDFAGITCRDVSSWIK